MEVLNILEGDGVRTIPVIKNNLFSVRDGSNIKALLLDRVPAFLVLDKMDVLLKQSVSHLCKNVSHTADSSIALLSVIKLAMNIDLSFNIKAEGTCCIPFSAITSLVNHLMKLKLSTDVSRDSSSRYLPKN